MFTLALVLLPLVVNLAALGVLTGFSRGILELIFLSVVDKLLEGINIVLVCCVHEPFALKLHLVVDSLQKVILVAIVIQLEAVGQLAIRWSVKVGGLPQAQGHLFELTLF